MGEFLGAVEQKHFFMGVIQKVEKIWRQTTDLDQWE
jgi:hypothetical protein